MFATKNIEKRESYTSAPSTSWCSLIAIGSSTGGTEALSEILSKLKPPLPPVMVVQHISATFSKLFAARLDRECELTVKEAVEGEYAKPNTIYIAPGDKHMSITGSPGSICIHCKAGERIHGVLSSADSQVIVTVVLPSI